MEWIAGFRLIASHRRLWPLCVRPLLWAVAAYLVLGFAAWALIVPKLAAYLAGAGPDAWAAGILGSILFALLWLFLFSYLFVILASLFAGFLWEGLAQAVEECVGGASPALPVPSSMLAVDGAIRFLLALVVGVVAVVGAVVSGPVAGWLAASLLCLLDYTSPAYVRRGILLGGQLGRVFRVRSLGFACFSGAVSLLPIVNVLLWPVSIAGGTLLVRRLETQGSAGHA